MTQQVREDSHFRNENPDSLSETSSCPRRLLKITEELVVQRNNPIFKKTHGFGEKMQLRNICYTTKTQCHAGHCSRWLPGWCGPQDMWTTQPGLDFNTEIPQQGVGPIPCEGNKKDFRNVGKKKKPQPSPTITTK